jgi:hypothetical protein
MKGRGFFPGRSGDTVYQAVHAIFALRINGFITVDITASRLKSSTRFGGKKLLSKY